MSEEQKKSMLTRRGFVVGVGATGVGLTIGFATDWGRNPLGPVPDGPPPPEVNAWVHVAHDDTVTVRIARSEMGQGTLTGLAQLVAEELECDWEKVTWEYPTPGENLKRDRVWGDMSTGGSFGIRMSQDYVRKGGAAARMMLLQAAADAWGVPAEECVAANSIITHTPTRRRTSFGRVADAAAKLTPPENVTLKDPKDWKIIGRSQKRLDTADKITGKQIYAADLALPGMLHASVRQCPIREGTLGSYDASAVSGMKGVKKVIKVDARTVAVIADSWWTAEQAVEALPVTWRDSGKNGDLSTAKIDAMVDDGLTAQTPFVLAYSPDTAKELAGRQAGGSDLQVSLSGACPDGADQCDGFGHGRQMRGLGADPISDAFIGSGCKSVRPAERKLRRSQNQSWRRFRATRPVFAGFC